MRPGIASSTSHAHARWSRRLALVAAIAAGWATFVALDVEFGLDLLSPWPLIPVGLLIAALLFTVVGLIRAVLRRGARALFVGIVLLAFWFTGTWASMLISRWQERETIRSTEVVLAALHLYRADHGTYPRALQYLPPDYIDRVPRTRMGWSGRPYSYWIDPNDPTEFTLSFPCQLGIRQTYQSLTREWRRHD